MSECIILVSLVTFYVPLVHRSLREGENHQRQQTVSHQGEEAVPNIQYKCQDNCCHIENRN